MKEYPVGSVCEVINVNNYLNGKGVTIIAPLANRFSEVTKTWSVGYLLDFKLHGEDALAQHKNLRLKRFPGDLQSWVESKVKDILKPVDEPVEDLV